MKISLKTKVALFVTLVLLLISSISTYLFVAAHIESIEKELIARGTAFSYSLARTAQEGLVSENLDLLTKASYIIQAEDVLRAQVFSTIWDIVDAYPLEGAKEPPQREAVQHFKTTDSFYYIKNNGLYEFYAPIIFSPSTDVPPVTIGYVRVSLMNDAIRETTRHIVMNNLFAAVIITIVSILLIYFVVGKLVIKPVNALHKSISMFKKGMTPENPAVVPGDEIGDLAGEFYRMTGTIRENEKKITDSEKRMRDLFNRVEHAIFRLDHEGNVIESNPRFNALFGTVKLFCSIMDKDTGQDCLKKILSEKTVHEETELWGRQGEKLQVLLSVYADLDAGGSLKGYDGYIIDVSEKKKLEEQLLRAQKMEAVGTLAGGIAHDFNNILTAVLGYSELIKNRTEKDDASWKYADIIEKSAKKGADLTNRILNITRKEVLDLVVVDVNAVIKDTMEILVRSIPKHISIELKLGEHIPGIKGDPTQLQQVMMNLAINARDAMPEGGTIKIMTEKVGKENGAANGMSSDKGFVKISVSDSGKGIDKETQVKVFDPFFTTKKAGQGTGLGLYIVHSIVSGHGGYINLYSEPDKGTRFNIYFPVYKGVAAEAHSVQEDEFRGEGLILVVDDEHNVRELIKDMVEAIGYSVIAVADGFEGINVYRKHRHEIRAVVLDMIMPRMSGSEVFQALQNVDPGVKVVLCSGYNNEGLAGIRDLLKSGAKVFIQKPFTKQTIANALRQALS